MDISDIDIYDDLDEFQEKEEKKSSELLELEAKYKESLETIELMKVEIKTLRKQQRIMEVNLQNLLDTAKTEIKRKNDQIAQLQREKDDICFRRKHASTGVAPRETQKQFCDDANVASSTFTHQQQANPFRQNAAKALEGDASLSVTDAVVTELPTELSTIATNSKRQLSPIESDESWKEELVHKKPRYDGSRTHRRAPSSSGKDEEATPAPKRERSHSRERSSRSYTDARPSRYKYNKNQRSSETEDRYNDYERRHSRGRRERERDQHSYHSRNRPSSREGRQRERHEIVKDRRYRNASRSDQERTEHEKYSKKSASAMESSSRSSSKKESIQNPLSARDNSKESRKICLNNKYERHEDKYERKEQRKARSEVNKKVIHLHQKVGENVFLEKYKIPKIEHANKQSSKNSLQDDIKTNTSKSSTSLNDAKSVAGVDTLPNTSVDRNSKLCTNDTETNLLYNDVDAEFSADNISNSSSDIIIFESAKDMSSTQSASNIDNNIPNEKSDVALNTPKKVALFDALFGQPSDDGDGTTINKNSKLLNNVLEIFKKDTTKATINADNKLKEGEELLSPELNKKQNCSKNISTTEKDLNDASDGCLLGMKKIAERITESSTQNKSMAKNITNNFTEKRIVKNNEIIEIQDDTEIESTDEEIEFFNIKISPKNSDITKLSTADLNKTIAEHVSSPIAKMDKTKKPVIEIIEDIRLPSVLPIEQILKIHEETCAKQNKEELKVCLEDSRIQSKPNFKEYSLNATAFNTDDELNLSDQTQVILDETNISLEVVSDDQLPDLEDIKERKVVNTLIVDNDAKANNDFGQTNVPSTKHLSSKETTTAAKEQSLHTSTIELKNVECAANNKDHENYVKTAKQVQAQESFDAIVYVDNDEDCTEQEAKENHELFEETKKMHNKPEITLNSKEQSIKEIDSNINAFDMEIEEAKQDDFIDKIVPVADMSKDVKTTLSKEDINKNNDTDVKYLAKSPKQEKSKEEMFGENVLPVDTFIDKQADCTQYAVKDRSEEKITDDKNSITNDDLEKDDKNLQHLTPNDIIAITDTISSNQETHNAHHKDINIFTIDELEDDNSIDKDENIEEEAITKTKKSSNTNYVEDVVDEETIKISQDQKEIATKDVSILAIKDANCDKLVEKVVKENIDNDTCENLQKIREEQGNIVSAANFGVDCLEINEEISCDPDKKDICEKDMIEHKLNHSKTLDIEEEKVAADIEINAEIIKIKVSPIQIDADIKKLEVDLEVNDNNVKTVTNQVKETQQTKVFTSCNNDIDGKASTYNENVPVSSDKTISRYRNTASNMEVKNDTKKSPKHENLKESSPINDISKSLKDIENCSKIAVENINENKNTETPKIEKVPIAEDQHIGDQYEKELEQNFPTIKLSDKNKLKVKSKDDKMLQNTVHEFSLESSDDIQYSAHDISNEVSKMKTASNLKLIDTGNEEEKVKNQSNEQELKKTKINEVLIAKDKTTKVNVKVLKHTETHELDHNSKIKELAINQLRELSAIAEPDEKYCTSAKNEKPFSHHKILPKQPKGESVRDKQPCKKAPPVTTKNYFKIVVAPKVEAQKRKLSDGYKIPKVKQPKLDITDDANAKEKKSIDVTKTTAAKFKDHKENFELNEKAEKKEHKVSSTPKNSTTMNSNTTASCSKRIASKIIFGEDGDKINIPKNNNTSAAFTEKIQIPDNVESKEPVQIHKLELCDPRNPLYSTMANTKIDKIKQQVNEKLFESQVISGHNKILDPKMSTGSVNANTHSELKSTTSNVKSKVSLNTEKSASTASSKTSSNQIKSKHFRRILDSSSGDEGSDEQNTSSAQSRLIADHLLQPTAANLITSNLRDLKRRKAKRRVVRVTTIDEASKTTQHEIPVAPAPVRAPPTPDHAIFHTEPEPTSPYAESALPQFNNLQDKQYTDIDSRLKSMFQSPPYVADNQNALAVVSENLLSPVYQDANKSPNAEHNTLSDSNKSASNLETKRLSLGTSQYRVEKVSENVVNVFVTRKRHKKKSTHLPTNDTAKPELLTSVTGDGIS